MYLFNKCLHCIYIHVGLKKILLLHNSAKKDKNIKWLNMYCEASNKYYMDMFYALYQYTTNISIVLTWGELSAL